MGKVEDDTMVVKGAAAAAAGGGVTGSVSIPASGSSGTTTGANSAAAAAGAKSTTPPVPGPSASPADFKATLKAYESRVDFGMFCFLILLLTRSFKIKSVKRQIVQPVYRRYSLNSTSHLQTSNSIFLRSSFRRL